MNYFIRMNYIIMSGALESRDASDGWPRRAC